MNASAYSEILARIPADPAAWNVSEAPVKDFSWRLFRPACAVLPSQGWKLHVSCTVDELSELVATAIQVLLDHRTTFKLPSTPAGLQRLNDGQGGRGQRGKIVTVYPADERKAATLLRALDQAWPKSKGPRVSGEARLRVDSPVSARYGAFAGHFAEDELGRPERMLLDELGAPVADRRGVVTRDPGLLDAGLRVFDEDLELEKELVAGGSGHLPLRLLRQGSKKVYTGVKLATLESVIIKAATSGAQGESQLRNEFRFLTEIAEARPRSTLAPRPCAFLPGAPSVLILEEVGGRTLGAADRQAQLLALPALAEAVAALHSLGIAHRDLKLENVVLNAGQVRLIDFDAAARVGDSQPPALGTLNHFGPEGNDSKATTAYDVYSLGVCIAHVLLQRNPALLPGGEDRLESLLRFRRVPEPLIDLVRACIAADPAARPSAGEVSKCLRERLTSLKARDLGGFVPKLQAADCERSSLATALQAGRASRKYLVSDTEPHEGWRNEHMAPDYVYEGLNLGAAGIVLGLLSLDEASGRTEFQRDVAGGAAWLAGRPPQAKSQGLFTGNAGVALALAVTGKRTNDESLLVAARSRMAAALEECSEIDLFSGKAGVLYAATAMAEILGEERFLEQGAPIVEHFLATVEREQGVLGWRSSEAPEERREMFTGPAHGAAGIASALGTWAKLTGETDVSSFSVSVLKSIWANARTDDRTTLRRFVSRRSPDGFRRAWCHGAAGHLWSILTVYGDDPRFTAEIDEIVALLAPPAPLGNPTYCHGFAGELELWRLVGQVRRHRKLARQKARETADLLHLLASRRGEDTRWSSEEPNTFTPDLWVGFLGPASALALWQAGRGEALLSVEWLKKLSQPSSSIGTSSSRDLGMIATPSFSQRDRSGVSSA